MNNFKITGDQITLLDQRYYHLDGGFYPSVTTILEAFPKSAQFYKWLKETGEESDVIKMQAGKRGSVVHRLTEMYDEGLEVSLLNQDNTVQYTIQEWAMFTRYVEFRESSSDFLRDYTVEMTLIDKELGEAGTLDRLFYLNNNSRMILDIKTSNAIYDSYWLQIAAYKRLFERSSGVEVDQVAILWLNAKTRGPAKGKIQGNGWQLLTKSDTTKDLELYECTKKLWLSQNEGVVPKQLSYKLKHQL